MQVIITICAGLLAVVGFYWAFIEDKTSKQEKH